MRCLLLLAMLTGCQQAPVDVLVFSRALGFDHPSITNGWEAVSAMGASGELRIQFSKDPARLSDPSKFGVLFFLSTSGDVLDATQQAAVEAWVGAGKGFVGVHAAADTEYDWPFYGDLVGARFLTHPAEQPADVVVADSLHPATRELPPIWRHTDEWYEFRMQPKNVHVLLRVDEKSYMGGATGPDHPLAWCHTPSGARSFYTALGHPPAAWRDPTFLKHIEGGLRWAAGLEPGNCEAP
jgi:type 1 glutamine amidotransferase